MLQLDRGKLKGRFRQAIFAIVVIPPGTPNITSRNGNLGGVADHHGADQVINPVNKYRWGQTRLKMELYRSLFSAD